MALEAHGLVVAHPGATPGARPAAGPLDLAVEPGEWLAVVGGNGSGKTALLLTLAGLIPRAGGELALDGRDPAGAGRRARASVGIVFQEPETQFVSDRVAREIAFPLENLGWPRADVDARVDELLDAFALRPLAWATPEGLSGGEMQRVALAAAVAPRPRYLLLDEPASYLDGPSRADLERWTRACVKEGGAAVVWTECDPKLCGASDRVLSLDAPPDGGRTRGAVAPPAPSPRADARPAPLARPGPPPPPARGAALWQARGLTLALPSAHGRPARTLWRGLDLEIRPGETWALVAPNGWGKTALLEALAGWREPTGGELVGPGPEALGYLAQFPEFQLFAATAGEDVGFAARSRARARGRARTPGGHAERVAQALAWAGLDPGRDAHRPPESLSLGERRRLALAGVLIAEPLALLLDEPTAGLDPPAVEQVAVTLRRASERGAAIVLATHDEDVALRLATHRVHLPSPGG